MKRSSSCMSVVYFQLCCKRRRQTFSETEQALSVREQWIISNVITENMITVINLDYKS